MLSPQLLIVLRDYWRRTRPVRWLFPGHDENRPLDASVLQTACRTARAAAKLGKPVTVQNDSQKEMGIELGGGQQAQLAQNGRLHLLGLIDDQHRLGKGAVDMRLPALAQDLGAAPAVVRMQLDAEELAHLPIEVGDVGLGAADHADLDVALRRQMFGQDAQGDRLAGAGSAGDEGEAALTGQLGDPPAEGMQACGDMQRLGRHAGGERVPLQAVEGSIRKCGVPAAERDDRLPGQK